jgi:hypothetical protein
MNPMLKRLKLNSERGQASAELVVILPIFVIIIVGLIAFVQQAYARLALITITNDCVTTAAQRSVNALKDFGNSDAAFEAARFDEEAFGINAVNGLAMGGVSICSTSYAPDGPGPFRVQYSFKLPLQPFKSDWAREP